MVYGEIIECDKCHNPFITYSKYKFFCEDCTFLRHAEEAIKLRNWEDKHIQRQWNQEAKETRMRIASRHTTIILKDSDQLVENCHNTEDDS